MTNRHKRRQDDLELPVRAWGHRNSAHVRYWIYAASSRHQSDLGRMRPSWMLMRRMYCGQSSFGTNCSDVMFVEQLSQAGLLRIRVFQQNLGYIQIYPDISVGIFSPSNVRAKRKTLLENSPHAQALRGKTDEHKMLLGAGCRCLQRGALSKSFFRSPWSQVPSAADPAPT